MLGLQISPRKCNKLWPSNFIFVILLFRNHCSSVTRNSQHLSCNQSSKSHGKAAMPVLTPAPPYILLPPPPTPPLYPSPHHLSSPTPPHPTPPHLPISPTPPPSICHPLPHLSISVTLPPSISHPYPLPTYLYPSPHLPIFHPIYLYCYPTSLCPPPHYPISQSHYPISNRLINFIT